LFYKVCEGNEWKYAACRGWTKEVDVFNKDLLIIPVCDNLHWSVVSVVNPKQIGIEALEILRGNDFLDEKGGLLHMDSIAGYHDSKVFAKNIMNFLWMEWLYKESLGYKIDEKELPVLEELFTAGEMIPCKVSQ
jgi:Ulp1 family protease